MRAATGKGVTSRTSNGGRCERGISETIRASVSHNAESMMSIGSASCSAASACTAAKPQLAFFVKEGAPMLSVQTVEVGSKRTAKRPHR